MYLHKLWVISLLSGFLSGMFSQASFVFIRSEGRVRYLATVLQMIRGGILWGGGFVALSSFLVYKDMVPENLMKVLIIRSGIAVFFGSLAFELCAAAIRRFQANRNGNSGDSSLD